MENKQEEKKQRGPKYTAPQLLRLPSNSSFSSWSKSLEGQLKHQRLIIAEAEKCAVIKGYKPNVKITKRFEAFFNNEVVEAQKRAKRKKKKAKREEQQQ